MAAVQLHKWTRRDYEKMVEVGLLDEDDRCELIEGEIYAMSPQSTRHAVAVGLASSLLSDLRPHTHVRTQSPFVVDDASMPEPDVAVVPGGVRDYRNSHPSTALLIVEISESSLTHDRTRKADLYARSLIPEYWVVSLPDGVLDVFRPPDRGRYSEHTTLEIGDEIQPLFAPHVVIEVIDLLP